MNTDISAFLEQEGSIPPDWRHTHPTADDWVDSKVPALEHIEVPTLLCAAFGDQGVHSPGGFKAFQRIGASQKWLYTHRWLKWDAYYSREVQELTKQFMDCFVRGESDSGWLDRAPVRIEIRASRDEVTEVLQVDAWPPPAATLERW